MSLRHLLPILIMALLLAPLGRIAAGAAKAVTGDPAMQTPHCAGQPQPARAPGHERMAIDCAIACAAMAPAAAPFIAPLVTAPEPPRPIPVCLRQGAAPGADPPPPRGP